MSLAVNPPLHSQSIPASEIGISGSSNAPVRFTLSIRKVFTGGHDARFDAEIKALPNKERYDSGDVVTLTAIDDREHGVEFVEWQPGGIRDKTITVTMDGDKVYTSIFRENFRVIRIYWFTGNDDITETAYDPMEIVTDVQVLPMNPKPSAEVAIEFSRPVDTNTTHDNLWIEEITGRIDGRPLQRYHPNTVTIAAWYNSNTKLKMLLHNREAGVSVGKLQTMELHYSKGIRSALGTPLANPGVQIAATEDVTFAWELDTTEKRYVSPTVAPSPTLGRTRIAFGLHMDLPVRLEVLDVLGRRVALLIDRYLNAGPHALDWDAGDLSSGVYWVRLTTGTWPESVPLIVE